MNIKQLTILKTLVKTRSYTDTARLLNYTQSNISQQIHQLEMELQNNLFTHHHKQLVPTEFLIQLLPLINDYIATHDEILNISNQNINKGTLKIAAPESVLTTGLSDIIKNFITKYPEIELDIYNNSCSYNQTLLMNSEVDIAFVVNETINNKYIHTSKLSTERLVIVTHYDAPDTLPELLSNNVYNHFVINEKDSTYRLAFEKFIALHDINLKKKTELWSIHTIKTFLLDNIGFSVLPFRTVATEIQNQQLKIINPVYGDLPYFYTFALTKKKSWDNPLIKLFLQEVNLSVK
ncbi:LysR family transcriptional regulator [Staphylococcus sp. ACRSN]|uniref:LysR family transcriptional regulator n=1 Tax=Staphylococcus sp. ACRSN TaxID=2918214 RepID=UPI001EF1880E|nr:LysR family transcriptional regulator [Staphylococcus sp. ACRSN]MCG7338991.1 LysR family transcriptional regulator [Staphylococcus sp. ACRSN]